MLHSQNGESENRKAEESRSSKYLSLQEGTNPLSTSPHSFKSLPSSPEKPQTPSTDRITSSPDLLPPIFKINIYGKEYLRAAKESKVEVDDLWMSMEEWSVSQLTKMSIKLMIAKRLWEVNPRYSSLFHATVE